MQRYCMPTWPMAICLEIKADTLFLTQTKYPKNWGGAGEITTGLETNWLMPAI